MRRRKKQTTLGEDLIEGLNGILAYKKGELALRKTTRVIEEIPLPNGDIEKIAYWLVRKTKIDEDPLKSLTKDELLEYAKANVGLQTPEMTVTKEVSNIRQNNTVDNADNINNAEKEPILKIAV
ncbi:MAG: hypothetical protein FWG68_11970 [Defluviitaleaceae bacterium]|nr:hypothetical protein [Defluviitaleaceae bacterium]